MTQTFVEGKRFPATVLKVPAQTVVQQKSVAKDGYVSLQIAIGEKNKKANKPQSNHLKKANLDNKPKWLREIKAEEELNIGDSLPVYEIISAGDQVNVTGTSLGKGFAGVMKRHGFHGGPRTHGQSDRGRAPGSVGRGTTPGRVLPGKKMAGHMGDEIITLKGVQVLTVNKDTAEITVKGSVPGARGGLVRLTITKKSAAKPATVEEVTEVAETNNE